MSPASETIPAGAVPAEEVRSERLVLRRVQEDDAEGIATAVGASLDYLRPWMPWATVEAAEPRTQRIRAAEADELWEQGTDFIYSVLLRPELTVIGEIGLHRRAADGRAGDGGMEIGYWIDTRYAGRGLGTEAAGALTDLALALPGVTRTEIHCDVANQASAAIPRKLGYQLDRVEPQQPEAPGERGHRMVWVRHGRRMSGHTDSPGRGRAGRASPASPAGDGWDWVAWHADYDVPGSGLAQRLAAVQAQIRGALDQAPPGPLRAVSMCAGQGRDLIEVLASHPRGAEVTARLVEISPDNAASARGLAAAAGLPGVEVVIADAADPAAYAGLVPADLVLACGVFGNITDEDVRQTIGCLPQMCASGGTVIWTRGRWAPDLIPQICDWFGEVGFEQVWVSDPGAGFGAGAHRFTGTPQPLAAGPRMFRFLTDAEIRQRRGLPPADPG